MNNQNNQGESKRQQQFARVLREELSGVFQKDKKNTFNNIFITITTVRVSPDLSVAKVYFTFLTLGDLQNNDPKSIFETGDAILALIEENKKAIRQALAQRIGKTVRVIPELSFFKDDSAEYSAKIEEILQKITIPPKIND